MMLRVKKYSYHSDEKMNLVDMLMMHVDGDDYDTGKIEALEATLDRLQKFMAGWMSEMLQRLPIREQEEVLQRAFGYEKVEVL